MRVEVIEPVPGRNAYFLNFLLVAVVIADTMPSERVTAVISAWLQISTSAIPPIDAAQSLAMPESV